MTALFIILGLIINILILIYTLNLKIDFFGNNIYVSFWYKNKRITKRIL